MFLKKFYLSFLFFLFVKFQAIGQKDIFKVVFDFSDHPSSDPITVVLIKNSSFFQSYNATLPQTILYFKEAGIYKAYFNSEKGKYSSVEWEFPNKKTEEYKIVMKEKIIDLKEVEIQAEKNRFSNKGDTLVINTENLNTKPNSDASEIFEKIGGLYQDLSGNISVKGIKVASITIDGKKIYGGNTTLSLKNLRADMIKEMHFTKKQSSTGNLIGHIEIKLRDDRKKGFFGEIDQKVNHNIDKYGTLIKGTTLKGDGIFNLFAQNNNINDLSFGRKDNQINNNNVRSDIFTNSTVMGLYGIDFPSLFEEISNENIIDVEKGQNVISNIGLTYSFEKKKLQGNFFGLFQRSQNLMTQRSENLLNSEILNQNRLTFLENNQIQKEFETQSNFSYKPNRNSIIWASIDLILNKFQSNLKDSTYFLQDGKSITFTTERQKYNSRNGVGLQVGYFLKGEKRGAKNLFFINYQIGNQNNNNLGNYPLTNQRNIFRNQFNYINSDFEFVKSIPIGKRTVFEPKLVFINENKEDILVSKFLYQNTIFNYHNFFFYQAVRFNISADIGYRFNKSVRQNQFRQNQKIDKFFGIQLINLNINKILSGRGSFKYSNTLVNPYTKDLVFSTDSSDIFSILETNLDLEPSLENKYSYYQNNELNNGWSMQINFNFSKIKNPTIYAQYINENAIGMFIPTNGTRTNNEIYANVMFLKNLGFKTKYYDFSIDFRSIQNNFILNKDEIYFSNNSFGVNNNFKWKIGKMQDLKSEIKMSYSSNNISNFFSIQFISKLNLEFKKKMFADFTINSNYFSFGRIRPILNFNLQKYFFKTDKISFGFSIINLLNYKENFNGQINNIQRLTNSFSILPRTFLLRVSIYPQLWKK